MINFLTNSEIDKGAEYYKKKKTPVPPSVKKITGCQKKDISKGQLFCDNPIYTKEYWKKYGKIYRVKKHFEIFLGSRRLQNRRQTSPLFGKRISSECLKHINNKKHHRKQKHQEQGVFDLI